MALAIANAQSMFADRPTNRIKEKWEVLMAGQMNPNVEKAHPLVNSNGRSFLAYDDANETKTINRFSSEDVLSEDSNEKLYLQYFPGHSQRSCKFRLRTEHRDEQGLLHTKNLLSTETSELRIRQDGEYQTQFIRVGLGNIDFLSIIEDGDISAYPYPSFYSKNQTCNITEATIDQVSIYSELQAPIRGTQNIGNEFTTLKFQTNITFSQHDHGRTINVVTNQIDFTPSARGDFDFMQVVFDSPSHEKVYGMGL